MIVSSKSRVTFAFDSKPHDGMTERSEILNSLMNKFFVRHENVAMEDILEITKKQPALALNLFEDLSQMVERIQQLSLSEKPEEAWTPALPQGGGKCIKLGLGHLPFVLQLTQFCEEVSRKLRRKQVKESKKSSLPKALKESQKSKRKHEAALFVKELNGKRSSEKRRFDQTILDMELSSLKLAPVAL